MKHALRTSDFLLVFAAVVSGMACTFVALSSWSASFKVLAVLLVVGVILTVASLRSWTRKLERETSVCKETLLVDSEASGEIVFNPLSPMKNPVLHLTAHGRPILVEDIWHAGESVVAAPTPIVEWRKGVVYPGVVNKDKPLQIIVRNTGYSPAAVRASLSARKTR